METEHIEYTRMIVPSSMRSAYWKYFGFPSDSSNQILTRQKIICTLCNTAITYNKNTTNLRTHLVARHPEFLIELNERKRAAEQKSSMSSTDDLVKPEKRSKTMSVTIKPESSSLTTHPIHIKAHSECSMVDDELTTDKNVDNPTSENDYQDQEFIVNKLDNPHENYSFEEIEYVTSIKSQSTLDELIQNMLIKDLLPSSIVEGPGFVKLVDNLGTNSAVYRRNVVEQGISKVHLESFEKLQEHLKTVTNSLSFSISIEIITNIEKKSTISVYINYIAEEEMVNVFYKMVDLSKRTNFEDLFGGINLKNCSAAIVTSSDSMIDQFFNNQNIPILPCFVSIISRCMNAIFNLNAVDSLYNKVVRIIDESGYTDSVPEVYEEYPWSKYNFLKFFNENVCSKVMENDTTSISKQIIDYLAPLRMSLDTLADEPLALSSLIKPLTQRLLDEHFSSYYYDTDSPLSDIKNIINDELSISILNNQFLSESSFFDPRFHKSIDSESIEDIKQSIAKRFELLIETTVEKPIKQEKPNSQRKSSLKLFFNRSESKGPSTSVNDPKRLLNFEFSKYINEADADLDQCPVSWWKENSLNLKQLKTFSDFYTCVPCSINTEFKKPVDENIKTQSLRYMLRGRYANHLWFLHFNESILNNLI